jgi:hypothetical protein
MKKQLTRLRSQDLVQPGISQVIHKGTKGHLFARLSEKSSATVSFLNSTNRMILQPQANPGLTSAGDFPRFKGVQSEN